MVTEHRYFWSIQWAGRWMLTRQRFTERAIRQEHPEAIKVDESLEVVYTPETAQERQQAADKARVVEPGIRYNLA